MINYISSAAIPVIIMIIVGYGLKEKNKVFDTFLEGAKEGVKIVLELFPTLIGIFLAVGALRDSGILDAIIKLISPVTNLLNIPSQILPLAMLRPISGSASMGVAIDIMQKYGVDSITRTHFIYNNGVNRNHIIYNSHIYKLHRSKENKVCISSCIVSRHCRNVDFCNNLEFFVVNFIGLK